jgi:hypothetical protein
VRTRGEGKSDVGARGLFLLIPEPLHDVPGSYGFRLRPSDIPRLLYMGWLVAVAAVLTRVWSLPRLVRWFVASPGGRRTDLARVVWLTRGLLGRLYGGGFCLPQSLVLLHYLSGWGLPVQIHFGVRNGEAGLAGHAWIDLAGHPVAEQGDPLAAYRVAYSYSPTHPR